MTKILINATNASHVIDNIREPVMASIENSNNNDNSDNSDDEVNDAITTTTTATTTATETTADNTSELNDDDESDRKKLLKVSWTGQDKINQLYYHHGLYF